MNYINCMNIDAIIRQLNPEQKQALRKALNLEFESSLELNLQENVNCCPHCECENIKKVGKARGVQRFKCKDCDKTFGANNKTPFYRTRKHLATWNNFLDLMFNSHHLSVRDIAKETGIHYVTAFRWRHKILHALKQVTGERLNGIVEADETYFPLSYKGKKRDMPRPPRKRGKQITKRGISKEQVCVLTATDRTRNTMIEPVCLGRISTKHIEDALGPHIAPDSVLLTDRHAAYPKFARARDMRHYALGGQHGSPDRSFHLQNVNGLHSQVKRFMKPFNGVATKYLGNYMAFYRWTKLDVTQAVTKPTASITCDELAAIPMSLK